MAGGVYPYSISGLERSLQRAHRVRVDTDSLSQPLVWLFLLIPMQILSPFFIAGSPRYFRVTFPPLPATAAFGIRICAIGMMFSIVSFLCFFIFFIRGEGKESFKLRNELELAHGIQKTLVPPVTLQMRRFEIYGISKPSEKVGGDLVDALCLQRRRHRLSRRHRRARIAGRHPDGDAEDRGAHRAARGR